MPIRRYKDAGKNDAPVGILMLDTRFERIPGDIGNPDTFPFPVLYRVVPGASTRRVVAESAESLIDSLCDAAVELVRDGAKAITTSCGFLAVIQTQIAQRCTVPVAVSSLLLVPLVQMMLPLKRRVGVLTFDASSLTRRHFSGAGVNQDVPVAGLPADSTFRRAISQDWPSMPRTECEMELLRLGKALVTEHPDTGAIVCECTNMAPYSAALSAHLRLPVFDIVSLVTLLHQGVAPPRFTVNRATSSSLEL